MSTAEAYGSKFIFQGWDSMSVEIKGLDKLVAKLNGIADGMEDKMLDAALFLEDVAREKAPKRTGQLKGSLESSVERQGSTITATVSSPEFYAPYQEFGTGLFAVNGDGRKTGWVYEDELTGEKVFTRGNRPHPFLAPALRENTDVVMRYLKEGLNDV